MSSELEDINKKLRGVKTILKVIVRIIAYVLLVLLLYYVIMLEHVLIFH